MSDNKGADESFCQVCGSNRIEEYKTAQFPEKQLWTAALLWAAKDQPRDKWLAFRSESKAAEEMIEYLKSMISYLEGKPPQLQDHGGAT